MWSEYNPNPSGAKVGDCAIRALCKALGVEWDKAYAMLAAEGFRMKNMPSSDAVWGSLLEKNGYAREVCRECGNGYDAEQFLKEHPSGKYVLAFGGHVAAADDGVLYDTWDSTKEMPVYFYRKVI